MCDQTIPYTPGTWVWAQLINKIWWPGKVVEVSSIPKELEYYKKKNKNAKIAVYFETDKSYELIAKLDRVCLYSCSKKMEFVEKGYLQYLKQKKGSVAVGNLDMSSFVEDVINVERNIGGNINICDVIIKKQQQFEESKQKNQMNIKDLFITDKERKKREKIDRRSSSFTAIKSKSTNKDTSFQDTRKPISKLPVIPKGFFCPYCDDFSTNRYAILKLHMDAHKNESIDTKNKETSVNKKSPRNRKSTSIFNTSGPQTRSSTPRKRRNTKTKVADSKKIKLQDELLKDWDDEDLDETESIESEAQAKGSNQGNDTDRNKITKVDSSTLKNTSNVRESTSTRIFDFDENEDHEFQSFNTRSSRASSYDVSRKAWSPSHDELILGKHNCGNNSDDSSNSDELNSPFRAVKIVTSDDNIHYQLSNVENNSEGVHPQIKNLAIDTNKEINNVETQDKADEELEHNIQNFLSDSPGSNCVTESLERLIVKHEDDKEYLSTNLNLQFDDLPDVPMTDVELTPANVKMNPFITDMDPNKPIDENDKPITLCFPKCAPVKTDEELMSSKEYKELMEISNNGGNVYLKIESPFYVKK